MRADSGFCREALMGWCEENGVGYVFGFVRNERVRELIAPQMAEAARLYQQTGLCKLLPTPRPAAVLRSADYV